MTAAAPARRDTGLWSAPGRVNLIGEHTDYNGGFALPLAIPQRTRVRATRRADTTITATSQASEALLTAEARFSGEDADRPAEARFSGEDADRPAEARFSGEDADRTGEDGNVQRHPPVRFDVTTAPGEVAGWGAYVAGVVWALAESGHPVPGLDLAIDSDVPVGAGLSSSAALECAVAVAIDDLSGLGLDRTALALLAQRAENAYVGAPTGAMDQLASMHGREGHLVLLDCRSLDVEAIPCDLSAAGLMLLVVDTRAPHQHVDGEYAARRRTCEDAARALGVDTLRDVQHHDHAEVLAQLEPDDVALRRVRHILTENQRVLDTVALLRAGRVAEIGGLLTASHTSLREDYAVTVPELDTAVDAAIDAGALGARMTGGGFGGSVIALVESDRAETIRGAVEQAFDRHRFRPPVIFSALPAAGAGSEES